jgi:penicillin-binding protein 2
MLIFDQLKKDDPRLRVIAVAILAGFGVLVCGLWWVQIVSTGEYQAHLEMQSFRTVRVPAVRGKILDRNGVVLAENRPVYNISLYLEELKKQFDLAYSQRLSQARQALKKQALAEQTRLRRKLNKEQRKQFLLSANQKELLRKEVRYSVASNVVFQISQLLRLPVPLTLNATNFQRHYEESLALPMPIFTNVTPAQIALFSEQCASPMGVDLEMQSIRFYPYHTTAAHVIGSVRRDNSSIEGEDAFFSYRLPDYRGQVGIEAGYDRELHGKAGVKSVVVNNVGYRQTENVWQAAEPGTNLVLTIDLNLQRRAERALQVYGPDTRGAVVVLDVQTGDILALASSPTVDPNDSVQGFPPGEAARRGDGILRPEINRATQENYAPGSIFKMVVGMACLETGLDPKAIVNNPGQIYVGHRAWKDIAPRGDYDFRLALMHSSNTYFISNGLHAGIENIIRLGQRLHLGERVGLQTRQETAGSFPSLEKVHSQWFDGNTANVCIGQGAIAVTPLQMAVMTAAIANGGTVLWPRLVDRLEPQDPAAAGTAFVFQRGRVRDHLDVKSTTLETVRAAMRDEVQDSGGTGAKAFVAGMGICGKTGTAQVMDQQNRPSSDTVWFASFAPYDKPRYAVVVMVEIDHNAGFGGTVCAPIARNIYLALQQREHAAAAAKDALVLNH